MKRLTGNQHGHDILTFPALDRERRPTLTEKQNLEERKRPQVGMNQRLSYNRLLNSTFLMLLATISVFYVTLCNLYPWQTLAGLDMPDWILHFAERCVDYVNRGKRKDVVILGSSLILAVSGGLEPNLAKRRESQKINKDVNTFELALSEGNRSTRTVALAAVAGAMVSDQRLILSKLIETGKAPTVLVYTYAPRDFIDNQVGDLNDTPTQRVFNFYDSKMSLLPSRLSLEALGACFEKHRSFISLLRLQTYRQIKTAACEKTGHAENLWTALQEKKKAGANKETLTKTEKPTKQALAERGRQSHEAALKADLALYRKRYLPVDQKKLQVQLRNLELMLAQAKTEKIKVLLFGMPISRENANILPLETRKMLANEITRIAKQNDARLEDLNCTDQCAFQSNDFIDSVHLNEAGAKKLLPLLVKSISSL